MRQPGSTFKPFVYATALDQGYTPVTKVLDAPFAAPQGPGLPLWTPENYEAGEYLGPTTLRRGVELSRNLMTARLANTIGMDPIAETVERMGVYNKLPRYLANSLGSEVTTLLRLTTGYAEFVNGGRKLEATLIDRVQDRYGKTVLSPTSAHAPDCSRPSMEGPGRTAAGREPPAGARSAHRLSDRLHPRRRRAARHRRSRCGRTAARRQDRNIERFPRRVVRRLLARPRGRRVHRQGQFPDPRQWRAGRARGRSHLPRFHEGSWPTSRERRSARRRASCRRRSIRSPAPSLRRVRRARFWKRSRAAPSRARAIWCPTSRIRALQRPHPPPQGTRRTATTGRGRGDSAATIGTGTGGLY